MTELLERVIAQLKTLPDDAQDVIAARLKIKRLKENNDLS